MILIKNGRLINPATNTDQLRDLIINDSKIENIGIFEDDGSYDTVIEASGFIVSPGFIDVHVHFRDPGFTYKETIFSGAKAAAKGGYTTVICMANTKPPIDNVETLIYVLEEGKKAEINVLSCATISEGMKGESLTDMVALKEAGAIGFTDDGMPLLNGNMVKEAMIQAKKLNLPLSFHEEDPSFITNNGVHQGVVSEQLNLIGSPAIAEDSMVARDCMIALHTGADVNIQHISSRYSVDMVRYAKSLGAHVWAEVTPHHFSLTEHALLEHGTFAKMNPPLRTEEDRQALIEGLIDGTIDMIATDHAPHSEEEKSQPLSKAPSGIIGLETALSLAISELVDKGYLTYPELIRKMSLNPAKLYHLDNGDLSIGKVADITIFNPDESYLVTGFASKSANSPFLNKQLKGKVKYTICNGRIVYQES